MLEEACHQHHHPIRQNHTLVSFHSVIKLGNAQLIGTVSQEEKYLVEPPVHRE